MENETQGSGIVDTLDMVKGHLLAIWRFRWLMVGVALIGTIVGLPVANFVPDKYEASTRLFVDTQTMLKPVLKGLAVDSDISLQFADITRRTLLNTTNIERIIREADLDLALVDRKAKAILVTQLKNDIKIKSYGGDGRRQVDNFYTISYANSDPRKAHAVVQSVLDIFIENSLGASRKDTTLTESFLNEQIKEYERRLSAAEEELKIFKQENINLMPSQAGGYFVQYSKAKDELRLAELQLKEAEERSKQLQLQLDNISKGIGSGLDSQAPSSIDIRINNMEKQLDDLLLIYTEKHPNVVSIREAIDQLQKQKEEQKKNPQASDIRSNLIDNKLYQELTVEHGRVKADVSALKVRVKEFQLEVHRLSKLIDTIPDVEAKLAQLNRDYEINKEKYASLVSRRESANISKQAEVSSDQVSFKIIEAPKVPVVPLSPNRPVLLLAVYLLSLASGALLSWLFAQMKPTVLSAKELKEKFGIPVLGTVSVVMSEKQIRYERSKLFAFIGVLVLHFVGSMVVVVSQYIYEDPLGLIKAIV